MCLFAYGEKFSKKKSQRPNISFKLMLYFWCIFPLILARNDLRYLNEARDNQEIIRDKSMDDIEETPGKIL